MSCPPTKLRTVRCGTSLVEVVVSAMLTGLVLVAALDAVGGAILATRIGNQQVDARLLAECLLAEVVAKPYEDPGAPADVVFGRESNESAGSPIRTLLDDVDDYHGWTESPPADRNGTDLTGFAGWSRRVDVYRIRNDDPTAIDDGSYPGVKKVAVVVTDPSGHTTRLEALRSASGVNEQLRGLGTTVIEHMTVSLEVDGTLLTAGTNMMNHARD